MWKRLTIITMMLFCVFSVGFVYDYLELSASGISYQLPSSTTMKLGEKGILPNGSTGSMVKGDKVYVGSENPNTGNPLSFILLAQETYNTYLPIFDSSGNVTLDTTQPFVTGWFAMGNESIKEIPFFSTFPSLLRVVSPRGRMAGVVENFLTSNAESLLASELMNVNSTITNTNEEILLPRNLDYLNRLTNAAITRDLVAHANYKELMNHASINYKQYFVGDFFSLASMHSSYIGTITGGYHLSSSDLSFHSNYHTSYVRTDDDNFTNVLIAYYKSTGVRSDDNCSNSSCGTPLSLRLSAELNMSNVVFATGTGTGSHFAKVKNASPNLNSSYSNI